MRRTQLATLLAAVFLPLAAHADAPPDGSVSTVDAARDPQVARLLAAKKTLTWNHALPGKSQRYGHAEALVAAPADKLTEAATDFAHYKDIHRKFATARVIARD